VVVVGVVVIVVVVVAVVVAWCSWCWCLLYLCKPVNRVDLQPSVNPLKEPALKRNELGRTSYRFHLSQGLPSQCQSVARETRQKATSASIPM